jgi:hypothetical protein
MLTREEEKKRKKTNLYNKKNTEEEEQKENPLCQIEITGYEKRPILFVFFLSKDLYGKSEKKSQKMYKSKTNKQKEKKNKDTFFFCFYILPSPFRMYNLRFITIICRTATIS